MIQFSKNSVVCFPITSDCNFHCRYCLRAHDNLHSIPNINFETIQFLKSLSPDNCKAIVITGGEPLLHWDKVKEVFSYVPTLEKRLLTNASLLTQEIVDYVNKNDIILKISHDGPLTEYLRGKDVLKDEKICNLLRQINQITCNCVITKYNVDVWENFFDTIKKLGREDIGYTSFPIMDFNSAPELIEGFDYDVWFKTWTEFNFSPYKINFFSRPKVNKRKLGVAVLPNGKICSCIDFKIEYGSILDESLTDVKKRVFNSDLAKYCEEIQCKFKNNCRFIVDAISEHSCRCRRMVMEHCDNPEFVMSVHNYVLEHLDEIKVKYNYKKPGGNI